MQLNRRTFGLHAWVALVVGAAASVTIAASRDSGAVPRLDAVFGLTLSAILLQQVGNRLRVGAYGSLSFVIFYAAVLLLGPFWAAVVTGASSALTNWLQRVSPLKLLFNISQRLVSIVVAAWAYERAGGHFPPAFLSAFAGSPSPSASAELVAFLVLALTYVCINTSTVNVVVSLSSGRPLREVWTLNSGRVLAYDLGASLIALIVVALFHLSEVNLGSGVWGLALALLPLIAVRQVYSLYHQLQDSGHELLELMVKAIEARDPYTSGHSLRVRSMSRAIAIELGLPVRTLEEVETAALLHDVGKIHEEFAPLLRKEAPLTTDEMVLMQTHAERSADLVGVISKFRGTIQRAVRHHHERWDGEGYPDGISGEEIPLISRIILIADTIDAMTTDRPYRARLPVEAVTAELQRCAGTQFDPKLVEVAISSVAVRRLIAGAGVDDSAVAVPQRSRRVVPQGRAVPGMGRQFL